MPGVATKTKSNYVNVVQRRMLDLKSELFITVNPSPFLSPPFLSLRFSPSPSPGAPTLSAARGSGLSQRVLAEPGRQSVLVYFQLKSVLPVINIIYLMIIRITTLCIAIMP